MELPNVVGLEVALWIWMKHVSNKMEPHSRVSNEWIVLSCITMYKTLNGGYVMKWASLTSALSMKIKKFNN